MANVHILGAGAVGLSFAHALSKQHNVTIISRHNVVHDWQYSEQQQTAKINAQTLQLNHLKPYKEAIENCFICVKSYQLWQAITDVLPHLADNANILISHNGMQDIKAVSKQLTPNQALYFVSTARGALKLSAYHVNATGQGDTYLGACNELARSNIQSIYHNFFATLLSPSFMHDDIQLLRWQKLIVNIAINPLSALHQIPNGHLRHPRFASTILVLLNEACVVAKKVDINLPLSDALDSAYLVMKRTSCNYSSMAQDVKHGRKTEIDAICGYVVTLAKQFNIAVPQNEQLLQAIKNKH
ncbi:2-dehydropantoate 2-reductase [Pseudoalteromonas holothuriae]|uniref:2-dehydropantoate 2-reductase n=1 Tax=Pseudoalteromonas holothuriae TaxID=2963714 RepID=A0ABN8UL55_9GAMM|nr:ketopantoate reductase family protein [Pseudoalteromonas sp. CIP111951]CAH9058946.1 2-dehydropantoate 2-reductase [Pseudoalteromonas sp. CIP111951]